MGRGRRYEPVGLALSKGCSANKFIRPRDLKHVSCQWNLLERDLSRARVMTETF